MQAAADVGHATQSKTAAAKAAAFVEELVRGLADASKAGQLKGLNPDAVPGTFASLPDRVQAAAQRAVDAAEDGKPERLISASGRRGLTDSYSNLLATGRAPTWQPSARTGRRHGSGRWRRRSFAAGPCSGSWCRRRRPPSAASGAEGAAVRGHGPDSRQPPLVLPGTQPHSLEATKPHLCLLMHGFCFRLLFLQFLTASFVLANDCHLVLPHTTAVGR